MASSDIIINGVTFTPQDLEQLTREISNRLKSTSKDPNQYEQITTLDGVTSIPVFQQDGTTYRLVRVLTSLLKGTDGREIFLQKTQSHLQWRWDGGMWNDLVELKDLVGDKGSSPEFRTTEQGLQWKYNTELDDKWRLFLDFDLFRAPIGELQEQADAHASQITTLKNRTEAQAVQLDSLSGGLDGLATEVDEVKEELTQLTINKADGAVVEDGMLYLTSNGEIVSDGIELPAGSGSGTGGGGGSTLRLINRGDASLGIPKGQPVVVRYSFSSLDYETQEPTGNGTAIYYVNNARVYTQSIAQGDVDFDITNYLSDGQNQIRVQVTDSYGAIRSLNMRVEVINLQVISNFDDSLAYEGEVQFPFKPIGSGSKTIHFVLDGQELEPVTTTASNRDMYKRINGLTHGSHSLEVFATMEAQGITITSDSLHFSIIFIAAGTGQVIISSSFHQAEATQYEVLAIPYSVYHPTASTAAVQLKANGEVVNSLVVDRKPQVWSYRIPGHGPLELEIVSGTTSKVFTLTVAKSDIDSDAETEKLELYLTSNGRSNYEENPETWSDGTTEARLEGFNFKTNGWVLDENNVTTLRISQGARVEIPFRPFFSDFKSTGKTLEIEFKVSNVEDFTTTILSCFSGERGFKATPNEILFKSALSAVSARFKEDETVRVSFVVEGRLKNRVIYIYINGIASGAVQYVTEDTFEQVPPVGITLGSDQCTLDVYNIRSYGMDLNAFQVLNNYIADTADVKKKLAIFDRNQVYDSSGEIQHSLLANFLPVMTIVGPLPTSKAKTPEERKKNDIYFENRQHPELSFVTLGAENDVQGTSSQYYPRKNFKWKIKNGITLTQSGETADKYALRGTDIPVNAFCMKADFVESSGTHNTGMAKYFDQVLRGLNYLTPPQKEDPRVRTTVDGYPCAIFHKETDNSPMIFIGKYNFNNDKGTQGTFGFDGTDECWEFLNNTSDNCLFKASDFTSTMYDPEAKADVPVWTKDFEARYAQDEDNPDTTNLKALTSWVVSCKGNASKFKSECAGHFNVDNLLSYYLLSEFFGAVDQRAKNMMMASWGNEGSGDYKYYFIFYDNDTVLGINNEGVNAFSYSIEDHDEIGDGHVWNGWDSELWKLVREAYGVELANMYRAMRSSVLSYDKAVKILDEEQADRWSEVVYNTDGYYKYIAPIAESGNASYLYALQGSRQDHRVWWLSNRFMYMDSKYNAGDFREDFISFRTYTPTNGDQLPVKPNADFRLTLFKDSYVRVEYASRYEFKERGKANETIEIKAPDMPFNDTETAVYGISTIKSIGSLASFYPGTVDISAARSLTELQIGSSIEGYENKNLTHITTGNNRMLRLVDIQNCPNYTEALDLKDCENIEEVYAKGSSISAVTLPQAGIVTRMELPATVSNLTLRNQPLLTSENLLFDGIENISILILENMEGLDQLALIKSILDVKPLQLSRVRLIGVDMEDTDLSLLKKLATIGGRDESGQDVPRAVITGKFNAATAFETDLERCREWFPELEITVAGIQEDPVTIFEFLSSQGKEIAHSSFVCNMEYTKLSDNRYSVKAPKDAVINFVFSSDYHQDYEYSYTVTTALTRRFSVIYIPVRTLLVYNQNGVPIPGAKVVFQEQVYITDELGKAYVRTADIFEGYAESDDHGRSNFKFDASVKDDQNSMYIYPYVNMTMIIYDNSFNTLLEGATITCNGETVVTDKDGKAVLRISQGTYKFTVRYKNNPEYEDYMYVYTSDNTKTVYMPVKSEDIKPEYDGSIQLQVRRQGSLTLYVTTMNDEVNWQYSIDWGDGTEETTASGPGSLGYTHSYTTNGSWTIRVKHCQEVTNVRTNSDRNYLQAIWSIGDSKYSNASFNECTQLRYVTSDVFKYDSQRTYFINMFYRCLLLEEIPEGIFDGCSEMTQANSIFYNCQALTTLPPRLFQDCTKLQNLSEAFRQCSNLESVPDDLLSYSPGLTNADSMFNGCSKLSTVNLKFPSTLKAIYNMFNGCSSLTSVNADIFADCEDVTNIDNMFLHCSSLSTIDSDIFKACVNVTSASQVFAGCKKLTTLPEGLFRNNIHIANFYNAFANCDTLTSVPEDLFRYNTEVTNFQGVLCVCPALTTIPAGLFRYNPSVISFYSAFNQSGLTSIPADLFYYNPVASDFKYAFAETKITSVPARLWNPEANAVQSIDYVFINCKQLITIEGNVFNGLSKIEHVREIFEHCIKLTNIPDGLFDSMVNAQTFITIFYNTAIKKIPDDLFKYCTKVYQISDAFSNCPDLTEIPDYLFANLSELNSVKSSFRYNSKITSIPLHLFSNSPKLADFYALFENTGITDIPDDLLSDQTSIQNISSMFSNTKITEVRKAFKFNPTQEIGYYGLNISSTFGSCMQLTKVSLSDSFNYFNSSIASSSRNIQYFELESTTPPELSYSAMNIFYIYTSGQIPPIYVPDSAVNAYKTATNWSETAAFIFPVSEKPD